MKWLSTIIRVAGSQFPGASALVQLQSEIDSVAVEKRLKKLEDPISFLHEDVPDVSKLIYDDVRAKGAPTISFEDDIYIKYSRSLAALDSEGYITCRHGMGRRLPIWIELGNATYLMYLCALYESEDKLEQLVERIDKCKIGEWLNGKEIARELSLPPPVVQACFKIYEGRGFGICSREIGCINYCGKA